MAAICYLTRQLGLGGAERQLYLLSRELIRRGHRVTIITFNGGRGDYWEQPLREVGVELIIVPANARHIRRLKVVYKTLRRARADIIHSWSFSLNVYAAVAGRIAGVAIRLGSERANHVASRKSIGGLWYDLSLRGLDSLVANSEAAAEYIREFRPGLRVDVVRNGVETQCVPPMSQEQRRTIRERFGIPSDALAVVGVGTLVARKNFSMLLRAMRPLLNEMPDLTLVLIGDGPQRSELEEQARSFPRGRVVFAGSMPVAARVLGAFDVLAFPSHDQEGMPNVLLEAAAAGLPVVARAVGGVAEVVQHEVSGILFDENSDELLTGALRRLLGDPTLRGRIGAAAYEHMKQNFSESTMATAMENIYASLR